MVTPVLCALLLSPVQEKQAELGLPPMRSLVFALAKASQDARSIAVTFQGGQYQQTYTVNIPVVQTVRDADGKARQVTIMRQETRTRTVQTGKPTGTRTQTYTVMRTEARTRVKDGKEETYTVRVPVTVTREVPVYGKGSDKPAIYKLSDCTVTDLRGNPVSNQEVAKRLKNRNPILIVNPKQKLHPFYQAALNQKILLVAPPVPKNTKREEVPPPAGAVRRR